MSLGIYIREIGGEMYVGGFNPPTLTPSLADAKAYPNLVAAQEDHGSWAERIGGLHLEAIAADPESTSPPVVLCELNVLIEIEATPLRGAVELFASLRKSSKYRHQFDGWEKVTAVISPSYGDEYCFRVAHNAYRHEDLTFAVKLPGTGEMARLDKFVVPKRKAVAA